MGAVVGRIAEETPNHSVVARADGYQVWRYPGTIVAVVRAHKLDDQNPPRGDQFNNQAFRALARYIGVFGPPQNNAQAGAGAGADADAQSLSMTAPVILRSPQKLAMTAPVILPKPQKLHMAAPVVVRQHDHDADCMMFVLPSHINTVHDAPRPNNSAISIEQLPPGRCEAVLSFSGIFDMTRASEHAHKLLQLLERDGVTVTGDWNAQGYNPPFTLPWLRRNEIHVPVDSAPYQRVEGEAKASD